MKKTSGIRPALGALLLVAPLFALDPITTPMVNSIYGSEANTPLGDSLKEKLEGNVLGLFAYREAGQSRHAEILAALDRGVDLLRAQYIQREAAVASQEQADSITAAMGRLDGFEELLDSLIQNP